MVSIRWPSKPSNKSTNNTAFIQYVDGREPQIHDVWILGLHGIICKVYPTAQVEVVSDTVREFVAGYLAGNGRRIQIIRQLTTNNIVQFLGVTAQS